MAFVFGSMASGKASSGSDIDLMIFGDVSFADVVKATHNVQTILGREINSKVYSKNEWDKMLQQQDGFIKEVLKKPKLFVLGAEHEPG